ncbi:MAG: ribonuclease H-like domain-containing protein [Acidobacteria bacterium]|nr:ribonuclease H-like domain-containing protein [Acidobacteriota bacterium]
MLTNTFRHVRGVSAAAEKRLWSAGIDSWERCSSTGALPVTRRLAQRLREVLAESAERLGAGDARHFANALPNGEHWRLFPEFRDRTAYLDIETTGLSVFDSEITTVALYDGRTVRHYVRGENLGQLGRDLAPYRVLVTYNGKCFDVPFLRRSLGLPLEQAHVDLRYLLRSLGYSGGLKSCERQLGMDRGELDDVDGYFAVLLWQDYCRRHSARSLETLLAYNIQDVVNLEALLVMAYNLKIRATPFASCNRLPAPVAPDVPFRPDRDTIARLRREHPYAVSWGNP